MNRLNLWMGTALGLALITTSGCRTREIELIARNGQHEAKELVATAKLEPKSGGTAHGEVTMKQLVTPYTRENDAFPEVLTYLAVDGLKPGSYTVRLHDAGDCSSPASSAALGPNSRSFQVAANGEGRVSAALSKVSLEDGDARSIVGKSLVVHEGQGESGVPVACGVIAAVAAAPEHGEGHAAEAAEHGAHGEAAEHGAHE